MIMLRLALDDAFGRAAGRGIAGAHKKGTGPTIVLSLVSCGDGRWIRDRVTAPSPIAAPSIAASIPAATPPVNKPPLATSHVQTDFPTASNFDIL